MLETSGSILRLLVAVSLLHLWWMRGQLPETVA